MKWIILLLLSTSAFGAMTKEQILKETQESGHVKKRHTSQPLEQVIPKERQKKLDAKKKKHSSSWSFFPEAYAFGHKQAPVVPVPAPSPVPVPSALPQPAPTTVVTGVDLRSRDGTVKDQIGPYCTAYGLAAAIENKLGTHEDLSEMHIWSFYRQYSADAAATNVPGHPITLNAYWPRENKNPYIGYQAQAQHKLVTVTDIEDDVASVQAALGRGNPVYTAIAVPEDMATCRATIRPTTAITSGGHAVEVVGYEPDPNGYWIIKNSWGTDCGDEGYQYMPFTVCDLPGMYCDFYEVSQVL